MTWNVWRARTHPEEVKAESLHRIAECLETLIELEKRQADSLDRIGMLMLQNQVYEPNLETIQAARIITIEMAKQGKEYFSDEYPSDSETH